MKRLIQQIGKVLPMFLLLSAFVISNAYGQHEVTGTVIDEESTNPLPGVNILVAGTERGTATDVDGRYTIETPTQNDTLIFRYLGYAELEVPIEGRSQIDVGLEEDVYFGEEVVVVGYGEQRERNVTGSVSSVSMGDMDTRPLTRPSQALQGQVSGVYALQQSGRPRADGAILRIRGEGTFNNADPLVIVDGFPGNMDDVNPQDIESISVLKDAASASIYGSRAANGVILIQTKEGTEGLEVSYNGQLGIQSPTQIPEVLNSVEYATLEQEAARNSGMQSDYSDEEIELFRDGTDPMYPDIDYWDLMYDDRVPIQNHQLNVSGGTQDVRVAFMLGYLNQDGPLIANDGEKVDFRTNVNASFLEDDRLQLSGRVSGNREWSLAPTMDWETRWYASVAPVHPVTNADGDWASIFGENNFYAEGQEGSHERHKTTSLDGQVSGELRIIGGLSTEASYAYRITEDRYNTFRANVVLDNLDGTTKSVQSNLNEHYAESQQRMLNSILRYNGMWNRHEFNALVGYQQETWDDHYTGASRSGFINNEQRVIDMGDPETQSTYGGASDLAMQSVFSRIDYSFDNRYMFEANLRRDGSSRFAEGNRWGTFPSFSAGWNLADETFLQQPLTRFDQFKLRASWGQLGNENIFSRYAATPILSTGQNYVTAGSNLRSGVAMTGLANEDVSWETTTQTNIGLDMRMDVLRITLDVFRRDTEDILMQLPIPTSMGDLGAPFQNVGEVRNQGIELQTEYVQQFDNGLTVNAQLNLTHVQNEITDLHGQSPIIEGISIMKKGESMHSFYGYETDGLYQLEDFNYDPDLPHEERNYQLKDDVTDVTHFTPQPGDQKYVDQNGDGIVDLQNDRTIIGNQLPDLEYGFNLNLAYRGIDFGMFLQGVYGIEGWTGAELVEPFNNYFNMGDWWMDRWTIDNQDTDVRRVVKGSAGAARQDIASEWQMQDASYLRIKNIELGYTLPTDFTNRVGLNELRIYGNLQNAYTFHDYLGFDPEQPTWETRAQAYPQVRIWNMGVHLRF